MKKQFALILILLTIIFGSLSIAYRTVPTVKATYVQGVITQDTIWTLVDSPFVLSNNVTVNSGATLTIEPGVQVMFGGNFSLVVNGAIVANGTPERTILFTTNDPTGTIAWNTIEIDGTQPSSFVNCIIENGTSGITVDSGILNVENSVILSNSENGIMMNGGTLTIQNSELANNTLGNAINIAGGNVASVENDIVDSNGNGVLIAGGNQVNVYNNVITSNGNGLLLTGQLNGATNIEQNEISLSSQSGILLEADTLGNTAIAGNNVTSNNFGLFISANASTFITNNYVSNNTVGIEYDGPANHQIYFNDIYENGQGVELASTYTGTVTATYNYWGQETGPQQESLNPYGEGNSVGGNGTNLFFIPWLMHPFIYNNMPPTAVLWTDKLLVAPGEPVTFVGTDSYADGSVYEYLFNFGDGANSGWTTLSLFNHSYSSPGNYIATLTVQDDFGSTSALVFTTITVANYAQLDASVTVSNSTIAYNGQTSVTAYVSAGGNPVANANVTMLSVRGGTFSPQAGLTDANGYFTANFTAPNVTETTNVRIIARASMNGYADGSDYNYVTVLPPMIVQVIVPPTITSEESTTLTVYVANQLGQPVAGANLTLSCTGGTLSDYTGTTDINGSAAFTLTAPLTLSEANITVTATATSPQYPTGQGEVIVSVEPRQLSLELTSSPNAILSEETTAISAVVTFDSNPVANATVSVTSDVGGNFSTTTQLTDATGIAVFVFTAPQTSSSNGLNATITATASNSGYINAVSQTVVTVMPKTLSVSIIPSSPITYSYGTSNVTVYVGYGSTPVQGANVTITATNGTFAQPTGSTDDFGNVTFTFTAPTVNAATNIMFSATASSPGYLVSTGQFNVTVNPRTFGFQTAPVTLWAGQTQTVSIHVTCKEDSTVVAGAIVTLSYSYGGPLTNVTNSAGTCTFSVNVPQAPTGTMNFTVTLARSGYQTIQSNVILNVATQQQGFPWLTVLLIAIAIVAVVVVLVLIKMKVIVISTGEETERL
jgi:hypothetical protein